MKVLSRQILLYRFQGNNILSECCHKSKVVFFLVSNEVSKLSQQFLQTVLCKTRNLISKRNLGPFAVIDKQILMRRKPHDMS